MDLRSMMVSELIRHQNQAVLDNNVFLLKRIDEEFKRREQKRRYI